MTAVVGKLGVPVGTKFNPVPLVGINGAGRVFIFGGSGFFGVEEVLLKAFKLEELLLLLTVQASLSKPLPTCGIFTKAELFFNSLVSQFNFLDLSVGRGLPDGVAQFSPGNNSSDFVEPTLIL